MNLTQNTSRKWLYILLAFAFPFVGMLILMLIGGYSPFGDYSMLYSDMYHQYFPFFKAFRAALLSGDSLLYNWSVGMGIDSVGLYSYYLASPLNLLSVLMPESWLLGYFSLLVPIKLGLASMFFAIFLQKLFKKRDFSVTLFGSFYGLCAWALGYQWNVMWLDTFALLPLVVLGMVSLLRDRKFVLYTITLFLSIYINYYIGLFTCFFVFLSFFCYEICRFEGFGKFFRDLGRIALFSALAIGMTAILSLPTLAALQNTQSSVNKFPEGFQLNIAKEKTWLGLLQAMVTVAGNMNAGIEPTFKEGLPNLYCGSFTVLLAVMYLLCKQVRLRDKICAVALLLFFNVSFIVRQLDYIWHGFHFTNMIPYRFSFLYSFVMLYMAYSAWINRKFFQVWQVLIGTGFAALFVLCHDKLDNTAYLITNCFLLPMYATMLICYTIRPKQKENESIRSYLRKHISQRQAFSGVLLGVIVIELALNLVNFGISFPPTGVSNYPWGTEAAADVIAHMKETEKDTPFYRAEVTHSQTLNDGALNGYNGISTFTSSANVKVTEFMKALGYAAKDTYNRYCFEQSSPVANLFLDLKYMIERDGKVEDNPYFDEVRLAGSVSLLENNAYLPLGFLANSQLLNVDFSTTENRFTFQNELMRQATGLKENVWSVLQGSLLSINGDCPSMTPQANTGYCSYNTEANPGTITYSYTAHREGLMCVMLDLSKRNNFTFRLNGTNLYSESYSLPQMLSVCQVEPGDVIDIQLKCKENENGTIKISAAILNETLFRQGYDVLAESTLHLSHFSNTRLEGSIHCTRNGVLYTSIPQNGNWHAYVDGNEVDTVLIGNAMLGLLLPEGQHTIRFVYRNEAFSLGWKISLAAFAVFIALYIIIYKPTIRGYQGKYQQKQT